jgi:arylsulfatase A-like enzyme
LDQGAFVANTLVFDATVRNLELIGEAATHVPDDVRQAHPQVPWRMIIATRNRLIHAYLGIDNDTLIILTSDNGPWWEGSAGGLRDRKGGAGWEGGYRVPFIARQPGRIPAGIVNDAMAMNTDLLPTLVAWCGAPKVSAELDGANISALLTTRSAASPHDELLLFLNEDIAAIRTQRYKYVVRSHYRSLDAQLDLPGRTDWPVLVDMANDPGESYDVSSRHPDMLADLTARLERARVKFDPMRTPKPG